MSKKLMCAEVEMVISWPVLVEEGATDDEIYNLVEDQIMYDCCLPVAELSDHPIKLTLTHILQRK